MSDPIYNQLRSEMFAVRDRLQKHVDEMKELLPYKIGDTVYHPTTKQPMTVNKIHFGHPWNSDWPDEPRWVIFGIAHKKDGSAGKRELHFMHYTDEVDELGDEFFEKAIPTKPGDNVIDVVRKKSES